MSLDVLVTGVGAGATAVFSGQSSSSFVVRLSGRPVLLIDVGVGAVRACLQLAGSLPDKVFVTHNHTDHAGELPVLLAVEAQRGRKKTVLAESGVMSTLLTHRLHELQSTGRALSDFGSFISCTAGQLHQLGDGLSLLPLRSRHAERCFGLILYHNGQPVMGFSADSGYDAQLYSALSVAPVVLLDAREKGTCEHAGFGQLAAAAASGIFRSCERLFLYGYGSFPDDAAAASAHPCLAVAVPGTVIPLAGGQQQQQPAAADGLALPAGADSTSAAAAAAAAAATAEAKAAASAAAVAARAAAAMDLNAGDSAAAAAGPAAGAAGSADAGLAARAIAGWAAAVNAGDGRRSNGHLPQQLLAGGWGGTAWEQQERQQQDEEMLDGAVPPAAGAAAAAVAASVVPPAGARSTAAGYPGVLQPKHRPRQQHHHQTQHTSQQPRQLQDQAADRQQQQQRRQAAAGAAAALARRQHAGASSATSTSSCTTL